MPRKTRKIGRPGYKVTKQINSETQQKSLIFEIDYPRKFSLNPFFPFNFQSYFFGFQKLKMACNLVQELCLPGNKRLNLEILNFNTF